MFFLHRFAWPDWHVEGHDPAILRARLEYLRKHRYPIMGVGELLERIENAHPLAEHAVVFTVDDGYADFASVAAPIFAAYDCPVTVFLITDFTDGKLWNWFDRVPWILAHTARDRVSIVFDGEPFAASWTTVAARAFVAEGIIERLKRIPDVDKERIIGELATSLEVDLPNGEVPERDRAMTWNEVRSCARNGTTFGPHTMTHPILSRVGAERAEREIAESWRRVAEESGAPVPVFCYPNGTPADFSTREERAVAQAGMRAAFSTVEASVAPGPVIQPTDRRFAIPRFVYPDSDLAFIQAASGIEAWRGKLVRL